MDSKIREALDEALSLLGELMSYDNFGAYPPYVVERIKDFIAPFDKNGIALLDAPVASDARDEQYERMLEWRGIQKNDACKECGGSGVVAYSSTATWHGGMGGQAITEAVCDKCWGSGDKTRPWVDLRKLESKIIDRERKAREETALKCAEAAVYYTKSIFPWGEKGSYSDGLRAAIMRAATETKKGETA